ncbi:MAG: hypothetical protein WCD42_08055 [Rhizomicrobium sp.]
MAGAVNNGAATLKAISGASSLFRRFRPITASINAKPVRMTAISPTRLFWQYLLSDVFIALRRFCGNPVVMRDKKIWKILPEKSKRRRGAGVLQIKSFSVYGRVLEVF